MTLTETAYYTRNIIKYGAIFLVSAVVLRFAWVGGVGIYRHFFPAPPPPPEVKFQKLPAITFTPRPELTGKTYTFSLQTPTGDLPTFASQANVYFIPTPQSSFLDLDEATKLARALGFSRESTALSEAVYRFAHEQVPGAIDINIVNKTFSVSYNLSQDQRLLTLRPRGADEALRVASSFLSTASLYTEDLQSGQKTFEFLGSQPENLEPVTSISEANFVRVNFWRRDYDGLPVITPRKDRSTVWILVSGETTGPSQVIAGEYHYFPVAAEQKSTYPIKTSQEAWNVLTAGDGLVISGPTDTNNITIRRAYLAYYDSGTPQQFLQPVVVFDGDSDFRVIVPAVTTEYYAGQ